MLATIGEGGYADGIRARLIRDRLMSLDKATPQDMLAIQLEDKALFLDRWRTLVLTTLAPETNGPRAEFSGWLKPRGPAARRLTRSAIGWSASSAPRSSAR